ncbi:MAG: Na+/H+ antiporter NhaC family protein [Firmicutes bacterium]|nr:Na+/H+ antiporter NhaC family protein [Bacillota bacterium]
MEVKKGRPAALLPIGVFLVLYLGLGILFEYVMKIPMGFYNVPIVVVFMIALAAACFQERQGTIDDKIALMAKGIGQPDIITMILIFLTAGIFVGVVGRSSAESVAYFILSVMPARYAAAVLFIISCVVSVSMGTSVGTVTLIMPIAMAVSGASGFALPLCAGSVVGGAMFGDNLSFISDCTIAACNGQGCTMKEKFMKNIRLAFPAAAAALILILIFSVRTYTGGAVSGEYDLIQVIPYVLVLVCGIAGLNVFAVLFIGIASGSVIVLLTGANTPVGLLKGAGSGVASMYETTIVALMVSALCALIRENGGFEALLSWIKARFRGRRGGLIGMGLLVGAMDIATANNTVAIVMASPIARQMREEYGISAPKAASILDTFSCIFQGMIPYGAQMLVAVSTAASLGSPLSAFDVIPYLFYPYMLLICSLISIIFGKNTDD